MVKKEFGLPKISDQRINDLYCELRIEKNIEQRMRDFMRINTICLIDSLDMDFRFFERCLDITMNKRFLPSENLPPLTSDLSGPVVVQKDTVAGSCVLQIKDFIICPQIDLNVASGQICIHCCREFSEQVSSLREQIDCPNKCGLCFCSEICFRRFGQQHSNECRHLSATLPIRKISGIPGHIILMFIRLRVSKGNVVANAIKKMPSCLNIYKQKCPQFYNQLVIAAHALIECIPSICPQGEVETLDELSKIAAYSFLTRSESGSCEIIGPYSNHLVYCLCPSILNPLQVSCRPNSIPVLQPVRSKSSGLIEDFVLQIRTLEDLKSSTPITISYIYDLSLPRTLRYDLNLNPNIIIHLEQQHKANKCVRCQSNDEAKLIPRAMWCPLCENGVAIPQHRSDEQSKTTLTAEQRKKMRERDLQMHDRLDKSAIWECINGCGTIAPTLSLSLSESEAEIGKRVEIAATSASHGASKEAASLFIELMELAFKKLHPSHFLFGFISSGVLSNAPVELSTIGMHAGAHCALSLIRNFGAAHPETICALHKLAFISHVSTTGYALKPDQRTSGYIIGFYAAIRSYQLARILQGNDLLRFGDDTPLTPATSEVVISLRALVRRSCMIAGITCHEDLQIFLKKVDDFLLYEAKKISIETLQKTLTFQRPLNASLRRERLELNVQGHHTALQKQEEIERHRLEPDPRPLWGICSCPRSTSQSLRELLHTYPPVARASVICLQRATDGCSSMFMVVQHGRADLLDILLDNGGDPIVENEWRIGLFHYLASMRPSVLSNPNSTQEYNSGARILGAAGVAYAGRILPGMSHLDAFTLGVTATKGVDINPYMKRLKSDLMSRDIESMQDLQDAQGRCVRVLMRHALQLAAVGAERGAVKREYGGPALSAQPDAEQRKDRIRQRLLSRRSHPVLGLQTPLHIAAACGNTGVLRQLLGQGGVTYVQSLDGAGNSPLSLACSSGSVGCSEALIRMALADPDQRVSSAGLTSLHMSALFAAEPIFERLIGLYGANSLSKDQTFGMGVPHFIVMAPFLVSPVGDVAAGGLSAASRLLGSAKSCGVAASLALPLFPPIFAAMTDEDAQEKVLDFALGNKAICTRCACVWGDLGQGIQLENVYGCLSHFIVHAASMHTRMLQCLRLLLIYHEFEGKEAYMKERAEGVEIPTLLGEAVGRIVYDRSVNGRASSRGITAADLLSWLWGQFRIVQKCVRNGVCVSNKEGTDMSICSKARIIWNAFNEQEQKAIEAGWSLIDATVDKMVEFLSKGFPDPVGRPANVRRQKKLEAGINAKKASAGNGILSKLMKKSPSKSPKKNRRDQLIT